MPTPKPTRPRRLLRRWKGFSAGEAARNDSLSFYVSIYNYENDKREAVQEGISFYLNQHALESETEYDKVQQEYMRKFIDILSRASFTDDPSGMFIRMYWNYYDSTLEDQEASNREPTSYMWFDDDSDAEAFIALIEEWNIAQRAAYN